MCWQHVQTVRDDTLTELVAEVLGEIVDIGALVRQLLADYPNLAEVAESDVSDRFADHRTESWRAAAGELVHDDIDATDGLADASQHLVNNFAHRGTTNPNRAARDRRPR